MRYFYIGFMILALLLAAGIWNAKEIEQRSAAVAKHLEAAALLLRAVLLHERVCGRAGRGAIALAAHVVENFTYVKAARILDVSAAACFFRRDR